MMDIRANLLPLGSLVAVAEMATVRQVQTHQPAVGRHDGLIHLEVGRAAAEALDVDTPLGTVDVEGLEGTLLAQKLDPVNVLVAAIVASAGVALGVLVGHGRAKGVEDSAGCDIFGGDEDDGLALALDLVFLIGVSIATLGIVEPRE
jgi:hypothetical protein